MSKSSFIIVSVVMMAFFAAAPAHGQQTMFMGKITTANDAPVARVGICIYNSTTKAETFSDSLGLFATELIAPGDYKVRIARNGKKLKAGHIRITSENNEKTYYILNINNKKVTITATKEDLFITGRINRIGNKERIDFRKGTIHIFRSKNNDSAEELIPMYKSVEPINPGMR